MRVSIPTSWRTVPPTVAGVQALITQLRAQHQAGLAAFYAGLIATPSARKQLLEYHFQAFEYVPSATQQPDFALAFARTSKALAADTAALGASWAARYDQQPGTTITRTTVVSLPAGRAALVEGVQTTPGLPKQQFEVYVLGRGSLLYTLTFRADAGTPGVVAAFAGIARRFALK
jgi:hypothetical protein